MDVYLIDGTYELFRHFFAVPSAKDAGGQEIGAVRGVLTSVLSMIEKGATHLGVATDHVVESFRNDLYPGYKTSEGVPADLLSQFPILEQALESMGAKVWPEVYFEADDALASAAAKAANDDRVGQVLICTPDKDLSQCVAGNRVVQLDRRRDILRDVAGVVEKFGVRPQSIPDYLAVVGDSADGYPKTGTRGIPRLKRRELYPNLYLARGMMHCSSALWRRCDWMRRCLSPWRTFAGKALDRTLRKPAGDSSHLNCSGALLYVPNPSQSNRLVG
jgi:5'-3' exonuclease